MASRRKKRVSRVETLEWLYEVTQDSIAEAPADRRSPLIAQLRGIVEELESLGSESAPVERNGLIDFQEALAERKSATKRPRSSASR